MEKYYLTLADGRKVRVLWNDYATREFKRLTGIEVTSLADGKPRIPELQCFAWLSIIEGEKADGKDFGLSKSDFIPLFNFITAIEYNKIMVKIAFPQN